jgi:hypothetical protein
VHQARWNCNGTGIQTYYLKASGRDTKGTSYSLITGNQDLKLLGAMRVRKLISGSCLVLFALGACSGSPAQVAADDDAASAAAQYVAVTSEYQREILSDSFVSDTEYERAVLATVAFIEESGFMTAVLTHGAGNLIEAVGATWQGSDDPVTDEELFSQADTIQTRCIEEYWGGDVDHVYHKQAKPTEAERVDLLEELVGCFAQLGVDDLRVDSSEQEFGQAAAKYDSSSGTSDGAGCMTQAKMAFYERSSERWRTGESTPTSPSKSHHNRETEMRASRQAGPTTHRSRDLPSKTLDI